MTQQLRKSDRTSKPQQQYKVAYLDLVAKIASGKDVNDQEAAKILENIGKTADDLAADAEYKAERHQMRREIAEAQKLEMEQSRINAQIAKAREALNAAEPVFEEEVFPLESRLMQIKASLAATHSHKGRYPRV